MRFVRAAVNPQRYGRFRSPAWHIRCCPTGTPKHVLGSSIVICGAETSSTWVAHTPFNLLPAGTPVDLLREPESDLLGWHFWSTGRAPISQYLERRREFGKHPDCDFGVRVSANSHTRLPEDGVGKEALEALSILVLNHGSAHRHHQRDGRINLLLRPLLRWTQVAAPVRLTDDIAETPLKHRIAIVTQSSRAHRSIKLDDRGAEVLRRRPELVHRDAFGA